MLKFIFWIFLLANGALFAYHQGYLDALIPSGREPARLAQQRNADKIRLLPPGDNAAGRPAPAAPAKPAHPANQADKPAAEQVPPNKAEQADAGSAGALVPASVDGAAGVKAAEAKPAEAARKPEDGKHPGPDKKAETDRKAEADKKAEAGKKADVLACTEIGNFSEADAGRFEARLAALATGARVSRHLVRETTSHMVYIPPQGNKDNADRKIEQLRGLGVTDFYLIQEQSEMRWGISLGVFSSEESARKRLEQLKEQGVRSARIGARSTVSKIAIQLRTLDAAGRTKLEKIKSDFPQQQQRNCA